MTGLSLNSRLGGLEPASEPAGRPSPHDGEFRRPGPSRLTGRSKLRAADPAGSAGASGPLRSQLPKSRTLPSPKSFGGRRFPRSLPASEALSNPPRPAPKPPLSDVLRGPPISGNGPFRSQLPKSRASGLSFSEFEKAYQYNDHFSRWTKWYNSRGSATLTLRFRP